MRSKTHICSVFTQIEDVVAQAMLEEKKATKIDTSKFPPERVCPGVWQDPEGHRAKYAIVIDTRGLQEFCNRVAELRA